MSYLDAGTHHECMTPTQNDRDLPLPDLPPPRKDLLPLPATRSRLCEVPLWDAMRENLTEAELAAALRDDLIRHVVGPLYARLSVSHRPMVRWAALYRFQVALAEDGIKNTVFDHQTALWAWLGGKPPTSLNVRARVHSRRFRNIGGLNIYIDPLNLSQRDIAYVEGVRVVTPLTVAVELTAAIARDADVPAPRVARLLSDIPERIAMGWQRTLKDPNPTVGDQVTQTLELEDIKPVDMDRLLDGSDRFARLGTKRQTLVRRRLREISAALLRPHLAPG